MKTAISIPDRLFRAADKLAKKLRISRSELYRRAVEKLVREQSDEEITRKLNEAYPKGKGSEIDPVWADYQARQLKKWTEDEAW